MKRLLRKNLTLLLGVLLTLPFLASCSKKEPLLLRVSEYRSWTKTVPDILSYPIPGHEDKYRRIFISPEGITPRIETQGGRRHYQYPLDTQIIKEILPPNWNGSDPPLMLTAMVKRPQDPRARGGWLWIVYSPGTAKETVITEEFCITCHGNANESHPYGDKNPNNEFRDYLFFPYPPPAPIQGAKSNEPEYTQY
jgi:hypothetical protein